MSASRPPPPIAILNPPAPASFAKLAVETPPSGMVELNIAFSDEFSPSAAHLFSSDPNALNNPSARHLFYNQQLYKVLPDAIGKAVKLGLPPIDLGFPLTFAKVNTPALKYIFGVVNWLAQSVQEGSFEWLYIQCYIQYALLCNDLTEPNGRQIEVLSGESQESIAFRQRGLEAVMTGSHAFFLGAAVRELELAKLNKQDALRGKKTVKSARAGGEARKATTHPDTDLKLAAMRSYIESAQSVANAARLTAKTVGGTFQSNQKLWHRSTKK